eukprot:jgi/Tetstr1/446312/TSEL_033855.t1
MSQGLPQMVHVPPDRQHFKNCSSAVGGGIGQLIVEFSITSRTQPEVAFRARWALMLGRYPSAESYIKKQLGANFPRWGAPWLQGFTAASFASSRSEGANKDYKHGVLLRTLTLEEAFDRVREVQARKAKKTEIREIHAETSLVDADKLCKQWFPDITDKLAEHVSGYATQLCHEEMGSSGNYRVVACHEAGAVPDDEDLEGEVTLHPVAEVLDIPVDQQRHARQLYGKLWGTSRTVTSLLCVDYGYVEQDAAEELLACLVRIEDGIRKRKALEAAAPTDRALKAKIQAVANVQDYNRPDNKAKGRRKCSKAGAPPSAAAGAMSTHTPASHGDPVQQLGFRVMRLCKPSLHVDAPLRLNLGEDMEADGGRVAGVDEAEALACAPFASRVQLGDSLDAAGLTGMMELPQSFGTIYLGETFCSYISVVNYSDEVVSSVVIKAEVQTERQKSVLADNTSSPLPLLTPGGRHDFIVSHDVKELGAHTLVCSAVYTSGDGERKYLPQYFKFPAHNPLSVRTKVRSVGDDSFLETCVENCTKAPLLINYVRFDPAPHLKVTELKRPTVVADFKDADSGEEDIIGDYMAALKVVQPNGGMRHFLYHLQRAGGSARGEATNSLGKLEIRWHGAMGEVGRLQTQQIMGAPTSRREVEVKVVSLPPQVWIHTPFQAEVLVQSHVERRVGPLKLVCSDTAPGEAAARPPSVAVVGAASVPVGELSPFGSATLTLTMVALDLGVQSITGLALVDDREGKPYDSVTHTQVFVHAAQ